MTSGYTCAACSAPAGVTPEGVIRRSCGHNGSSVVAHMTATAYGEGSMAHGNLFERLAHRVLKAMGKRK